MTQSERESTRALGKACLLVMLAFAVASLLATRSGQLRPRRLSAQSPPPAQLPPHSPATYPPSPAYAPPAPPVRPPGPSAREVVQMALKAAHLVDPERVAQLVRRARLSGLSPTLRLGADRGLRQDLSSQSSTEVEKQASQVADDFRFDALLTFDLSRLVFAPEEVRLMSVQRWLAGDQRKLAEDAVQLYFRRRKLIDQERSAPPSDRALIALAIEEAEALLDALTHGEYAAALMRVQASSARVRASAPY
jgi:hypothetical protein